MEPLRFKVAALKVIGQQYGDYQLLEGRYVMVKSGPVFVRVSLGRAQEGDYPDIIVAPLKVQEHIAPQFPLGSTVEIWPSGKPKKHSAARKIRLVDQES